MSFQPGTSNRTAIRLAKETVFNTIPTSPAFQNMRYTGETIAYAVNTVTSSEIRADRMTSDLIVVGASVSGDVNFELSYGSFDTILEAAMASTWGAPGVGGASSMKNGVVAHSFTLQKHFQDLATPYFQNFSGCRIGTLNLDFQTGAILTGSFNVMGCQATQGPTQIAGATFTNPGEGNTPMNAVANVASISKDGVPMAAKIRSTSFALTNNLRGQEAIGTLGYIGIALGRLEITGNIELYFENADEYTTFLNNQDFEFTFVVRDVDGNEYEFSMPRVKYESGTIQSGGLDQDLVISGSWRALYDPTAGCMIEITRTPA